jgi:hypothetical protein
MVHLIHRSVEVRLEVPMRSETLLNVTRPSVLRMKLNGLEVVDVLWVEEHVSHRGGLTVQFEGMSREHYTFSDDPCRVWVEERPHRHQIWSWEIEATNVSSELIEQRGIKRLPWDPSFSLNRMQGCLPKVTGP